MSELNVNNRTLFHADNLDILRNINSECIDLIATDPPFNKGKDFHATPDSMAAGSSFKDRWSWKEDIQQVWIDQIKDDCPAVYEVIDAARFTYGDDMAAYLCWMAVRLVEMHRVLKPTGSLFLHCDDTASSYLKILLDGIFKVKNFRNEIIWQRRPASAMTRKPKYYGRNADHILYYAKSDKHICKPFLSYTEEDFIKKGYILIEKETNRKYKWDTPFASKSFQYRKSLEYEWRGFISPTKNWGVAKEKLEKFYQEGRIVIEGNKVKSKSYADERLGHEPGTIWTDISMARGKEKTGYPTQKPLKLYERIISASSNEGDIVLDPFAGCATTPIAAERLNREWVGIDIWEGAEEIVNNRIVRTFEKERERTDIPQCILTRNFPTRTDLVEEIVPYLDTPIVLNKYNWEKLTHQEMKEHLIEAQSSGLGIGCAGCGRVVESEFTELDHITPKDNGGDNAITNRVLLCTPCNRKKRQNLTISGLIKENKKDKWMRDETLAKQVFERAKIKASKVRAEMSMK